MNKPLLLGFAFAAALSASAQNSRLKPNGPSNKLRESMISESAVNKTTTGPGKSVTKPATTVKTSSTIATSCTHFAGSYNALGVYLSGQECLQYNADVNAVTFVHRAAPCYSLSGGNSGTQVVKYSINNGSNWDSTVFWQSTVNFGRYPQGGLYNPIGNTNVNNAYVVGAGPTNQGGPWNGSFIASKKITTPGTTSPGTDMQFFPNTPPFGTIGKKFDFPRYGFNYTKDGLVRMIGVIQNDANGTTNPTYGVRGFAVLKGTFNAGAFVWSYDSLVPATIMRTDGSKQMTDRLANMAWNDAGTVGYVMMLGARAGSTGTMKGYQPIIYKTTNSGASWSLMPPQDFADPVLFRGVVERLWSTSSNTNLAVPYFNFGEGMDMIVDINNNLHIATTIVGSYSNNNDSLDYTFNFGTEKYSYQYGGNFGFPTIYDFYTTSSGGWNYHMVDSMGTEGPSGTSGQGGFGVNPWASGTTAASLEARIQICTSPDRKKIFYSWTESDTTVVGLYWNIYPNIMSRGFDVTIDKVTPRVNITGGVTTPDNADQVAYFHYMSNRAITTNVGLQTNEIPFTISYNSTNDAGAPTNHYYLKGASFTQTDFTLNPMRPTGIQAATYAAPGYEVMSYPNPTDGLTTISVAMPEAKDFEVTLYNTLGAEIKNIKVTGHAGSNNVNLDLSSLNAGMYTYTVKTDNSAVTKKLIVE